MSELQTYFDTFKALASGGEFCGGETCRGWFLSDVDTWHACACGRGTAANHPENDYPDFEGPSLADPTPAEPVVAPQEPVDPEDIPF